MDTGTVEMELDALRMLRDAVEKWTATPGPKAGEEAAAKADAELVVAYNDCAARLQRL